jgi:hypothetical protein
MIRAIGWSSYRSRMPTLENCSHAEVDVSQTWIDAEGKLRHLDVPVSEIGVCLRCGKRLKRSEDGPWKPAKRKRGKSAPLGSLGRNEAPLSSP